jgi:ubiquinone/menaquinone biosynthesis C-methylase UbiE
MKDDIIARYAKPSAYTPFALEYAYHLLGDVTGKIVLDYGCGTGDNGVLIASHGGSVIGVDISQDLIDLAEKRLELHGYKNKVEFRVGSAHDLPLEDESVDVVYGIAILHHLDLDLSAREVFRVLKKGGTAIFMEPARNSKLVWFLRNLIPYKQPDLSPYERPLTDKELELFGQKFDNYQSRAFSLPFVNLIEVLGLSQKILYSAINLDGKLLKSFKFLSHYASVRVIKMTK